jgi:homopolymeric O-antigen transport system ATP-binding protein
MSNDYSTGDHMRHSGPICMPLYELGTDFYIATGGGGRAVSEKVPLGRMGQVASQGRTILLVSHNMAAAQELCSRAVWPHQGRLTALGQVAEVLARYVKRSSDSSAEKTWRSAQQAPGNEHIILHYVRVRPPQGDPVITIDSGVVIEIGFYNADAGINLDCTVYLLNNDGLVLCEAGRLVSTHNDSKRGSYRVLGQLPPHLLSTGRYYLSVQFGKDQYYPLFRLDEAVCFTVENTATERGSNMNVAPGVIRPLLEWRQEFCGAASHEK